jgi:hypothetical protein
MSRADKLASAVTGDKTPSKVKDYFKRATAWVDNNVLPVIAAAVLVLGFADSALHRIKQFAHLPETAQGAIVVVVLAFVVSRAYKLISK